MVGYKTSDTILDGFQHQSKMIEDMKRERERRGKRKEKREKRKERNKGPGREAEIGSIETAESE